MTVQQTIETKINDALAPSHLMVVNESYMHNVPPGSESHFKVIIISEIFEGERLVRRHQRINKVLAEELRSKIHALALQTLTPKEWRARGEKIMPSPKCLGGSEGP